MTQLRSTDVLTSAESVCREGEPMSSGFVPSVVSAKHLYKVPEAMQLLSMSRSVLYEQMRAGRLRYVKQGAATLIPAVAIQNYVALLLSESEVDYGQAS